MKIYINKISLDKKLYMNCTERNFEYYLYYNRRKNNGYKIKYFKKQKIFIE